MRSDNHDGTINDTHYSSAKTKRVCTSVLEANLLASVAARDINYLIKLPYGKCVAWDLFWPMVVNFFVMLYIIGPPFGTEVININDSYMESMRKNRYV